MNIWYTFSLLLFSSFGIKTKEPSAVDENSGDDINGYCSENLETAYLFFFFFSPESGGNEQHGKVNLTFTAIFLL